MAKRKSKSPVYYLTFFKVEGHELWRAAIHGTEDAFDLEANKNKFPKITDRRVTIIDRTTGIATLQ